jgi:hypothetical protein
VKTSMKFGSQYGCSTALNCRMFITLFSYLRTAAAYGRNRHDVTMTSSLNCSGATPWIMPSWFYTRTFGFFRTQSV